MNIDDKLTSACLSDFSVSSSFNCVEESTTLITSVDKK